MTKKKTKTIKDTSDPVYETTFRYLLSPTELKFRELELVIATKHLFYNISYGTSSNIGRVSFVQTHIKAYLSTNCVCVFFVFS